MKKDFIKGYLCAVASLIEMDRGVQENTKDLFKAGVKDGTTLSDLKKIGIDDSDLEKFQVYWDELH